jgi:hypothetical protein
MATTKQHAKLKQRHSCDCSITIVGQVLFFFKLVMIVLGAAGCGLAFMVAVLALGTPYTLNLKLSCPEPRTVAVLALGTP